MDIIGVLNKQDKRSGTWSKKDKNRYTETGKFYSTRYLQRTFQNELGAHTLFYPLNYILNEHLTWAS